MLVFVKESFRLIPIFHKLINVTCQFVLVQKLCVARKGGQRWRVFWGEYFDGISCVVLFTSYGQEMFTEVWVENLSVRNNFEGVSVVGIVSVWTGLDGLSGRMFWSRVLEQ